MTKEEKEFIQKALRVISLALCSTHNTVTTDVPKLCVEDDEHWKIDNSKEMDCLKKIEEIIAKSN